jgi:hypothetical protein
MEVLKDLKISNTDGTITNLIGSNIEIVGELPTYYLCRINDDELPTLIIKKQIDKIKLAR